jgi:hypothetical protein
VSAVPDGSAGNPLNTHIASPDTDRDLLDQSAREISTLATAAASAGWWRLSGVTIFRRGQLSVEIGSNAGGFAHNIQTARAEEQVGAAVMRPRPA